MAKLYPFFFSLSLLFFFQFSARAACNAGQSEVQVTIVPDGFPSEISWSLRDASTGVLIDTGNHIGDTLCVPSSQCIIFRLFDTFGDGLLGNGSCTLKLNGILLTTITGDYNYLATYTFNCPPGSNCSSPSIVSEGNHTAPQQDTWYRFTADSSGNYTISTCALGNVCDTRIYGYTTPCASLVFDDAGMGVSFYNDDFCGNQSEVVVGVGAGQSIIFRIGDSATSCAGNAINWKINFSGAISGCTDPAACNYNPLAEVSDGSCVYSGPLCAAPDLAVDKSYLESSMYLDNFHNAVNCEVDEGCILGYGTRRLLKYGVQIWNYGNQPYYVGNYQNNPNAFEFAPCHGHYHYLGFAESYLYNSTFQQVDFARKTSYAIINMQCLPGSNPGGPALAPGCSDIYSAGYACQWVDVTDMDTGLYYLILKVNSGHFPDYLGRSEQNYGNNSTLVCFQLTKDVNGNKDFQLQNNCSVYVDCKGDTFGNAIMDCAGNCDGWRMRGDVDLDTARTIADVNLYLDGIAGNMMQQVPCNELTGDNKITVYDAARLNACIRSNDSTHMHIGNPGGNHSHCNFPFGIENMLDTVTIGLSNPQANYLDVTVLNPKSYVLGYEFNINGILIDSIKNIAGNYNPELRTDGQHKVIALSVDEFSLNKTLQPLSVLRVFFRQRTDTVVCISSIDDVVNGNYERVAAVAGSCVVYAPEEPSMAASLSGSIHLIVVPNPSQGIFEVSSTDALLEGCLVNITNSLGEIVMQTTVRESNNRFTIDLTGMARGVYHLQLKGREVHAHNSLVLVK